MKGGHFGLSLPGPDLALVGFRIVSKKWTDQCEDCSLKKKQSVTAIVGHFSLNGKAPTKNQPHTLTQQVLTQQIPKNSVIITNPRAAGRTKRRYRTKTKILKEGARGDWTHLIRMKAQYQTFQTRYSSILWYA